MQADPDQESARVIMETRVIQNLIFSYFNIVKKNISDMVPKTVMAFLVNDSRKMAHSELVAQIYKSGDLDSLLVEDPMVVEQRDRARKVIHALRQAQEILNEVAKYDI
jgi:dynamin 1-like protein